jgi:hypothetical protein
MLPRGGHHDGHVMARRDRARRWVAALAELAAIVVVLGAIGAALGIGISQLSDDAQTLPPATRASTTTAATRTTRGARRITPGAAVNAVVYLRVTVLDARLFTDEAPSGTREQPARMTVRIHASNPASERVTLAPPVLAVGSMRIPTDPDPDAVRLGSQFGPLPPGAQQTVTLRFALAGEATPKVVRDRRARLLIAGRSVATTVRVRGPADTRLRQ